MISIIGGRGRIHPVSLSGCGLYLDIRRGVTLVSGKISQWNDLSGNNRHFTQTEATRRPTYEAAGLNGMPTAYFNKVHFLSKADDSLLRNVNGCTVIAVYKSAGTTATGQCLFWFSQGGGSNSQRFVSWQDVNSNSVQIYGRRLDADSSQGTDAASNFFVTDTAHVYTWIADWADSAAYTRRGGSQKLADTTWLTNGYTSDTNSTNLAIGAYIGVSYQCYGRLSALAVYQRKLNVGELASVEQFLAFDFATPLE